MTRIKNTLIGLVIISVTALNFSGCVQKTENPTAKKERIKTILFFGQPTTHFIYNKFGKVEEEQGHTSWSKFYYDNNGLIQKSETASDPTSTSSSVTFIPPKIVIMTAANSTVTSYDLFEHDQKGRVIKIKHYFKMEDDVFEYRSTTALTYDGSNIIKSSLEDSNGVASSYTTFKYDTKGNVTNEKYYGISANGPDQLITETSYKYDDNKNPYLIYKELAWAPYYTNTNNIIESVSTLSKAFSNNNNTTISKTSYKYNSNGFPIKSIGESKLEYQYE